ncbi:MAG TPA: ACT domain-containing protein [Actinomycetota bacterium]|nr:ACT domain-containing protein [Actinomycetota bacterium]
MAKDLTVSLEDRPGTLADLGEALGNAGVNIEGICGIGMEGRGIIHVLVEDAAAARKALEGAGIKVEGEADPMLAEVAGSADTPGELGRMARAIANAGVNIQAMYIATHDRGVIVTTDNATAAKALGM